MKLALLCALVATSGNAFSVGRTRIAGPRLAMSATTVAATETILVS